MKIKKYYYILIGTLFFIPQLALAVETEFGNVNNITEYVSQILSKTLPIIAGLALLVIIYAGYLYVTSQGNPEQIVRAKDLIIGVVTGVVLLFLIKVILDQIGVK